jgi:hypothetical protein
MRLLASSVRVVLKIRYAVLIPAVPTVSWKQQLACTICGFAIASAVCDDKSKTLFLITSNLRFLHGGIISDTARFVNSGGEIVGFSALRLSGATNGETLQRTDRAQSDPRIETTVQPRQPTSLKVAYVARSGRACCAKLMF